MPEIWPRGKVFSVLVACSSIAAPKANKASSPHQRASIGTPSPHQGGQLAPQQPKGGGGQGGVCAGPPARHLARAQAPPPNRSAIRRQGGGRVLVCAVLEATRMPTTGSAPLWASPAGNPFQHPTSWPRPQPHSPRHLSYTCGVHFPRNAQCRQTQSYEQNRVHYVPCSNYEDPGKSHRTHRS